MTILQIGYPLCFDARRRTVLVDGPRHVRDMVEQLLLTSPGERVNRPDFGSGLAQLVFTPNSPELAAALEYTLRAALQRWLGDVIAVQTLTVESEEAILRIHLEYVLLATGEPRNETFTVGEAS